MKRLTMSVLVSGLTACFPMSGQSGIITTVAGGGVFTYPADVTIALNAPMGVLPGIAVDSHGIAYVADTNNNRVFMISPSGSITTVAGGGTLGDGAAATSAFLYGPSAVAVDAAGNPFIADTYANRIRKVSAAGIISTVAGNGSGGFSGDFGPAPSAWLAAPRGIAVDSSGTLFIADTGNHRIRKVSADGIITTIAGNGTPGFSGDGGPATSAQLFGPTGVTLDTFGSLLIADFGNERIRKVSTSGIITTIAGNGIVTLSSSGQLAGFSGDGGPATSAQLFGPSGLTVDGGGNILFCDTYNNRIRKISTGGIITTVAGNGIPGFSGDGGPATAAWLYTEGGTGGVAVDVSGKLFIADGSNGRIREVTSSGNIITIAGNGGYGFSGDGGPATSAALRRPTGVAVDSSGNLIFSDSDNNRIRMVSGGGVVTTIAGNGSYGFSGDGGPATSAQLFGPQGLATDTFGNLFFVDFYNQRIRKVSASGNITTVAGKGPSCTGTPCGVFSGDGGAATSAALNDPIGVSVDVAGNVYIADTYNNRIRKVSVSRVISTVAGNGIYGFSGDGGPALSAQLARPGGVAADEAGNLFIADSLNGRIRKVSPSGIVTTVAGNGIQGFSGDGGPATSAALNGPNSPVLDASGDLFFADGGNYRVRKISPDGTITTVAGNGTAGFSGDGGPATSAGLTASELALDASGNLFIADFLHNRIRRVSFGAGSLSSVTAAPASLNYSLVTGASASQQINLGGTPGIPWSASASAKWITLTPMSGTTPGTVTVASDATSLQPGTYTAAVTISNPLASPAEEVVNVSLTVSGASFSVTPAALNFQSRQGAPPQSQSLQNRRHTGYRLASSRVNFFRWQLAECFAHGGTDPSIHHRADKSGQPTGRELPRQHYDSIAGRLAALHHGQRDAVSNARRRAGRHYLDSSDAGRHWRRRGRLRKSVHSG